VKRDQIGKKIKPAEFGFKAEEAKPRTDPQWEERHFTADVGFGQLWRVFMGDVIFGIWIAYIIYRILLHMV
jgi:hypothetical protein